VGSIDSRLRHLEERGGLCPECVRKPAALLAYYPEHGESAPQVPTCPECGRSLAVVLRVVYDDEDEGGGGYRWP
jgi:hypothetical protein